MSAQQSVLGILAGLLLGLALAPALAQYKVVGPDGRITYTDRPAPQAPAQPLRGAPAAASAPASPALPAALREPAARFPVQLYTARDCPPCDRGRDLLKQRGIPYREWQAPEDLDRDAWRRLVGSEQVPSLRVGQQLLSGLDGEAWDRFLDTAGYPAQSVLPVNWPAAVPQPLAAAARAVPPATAPSVPTPAAVPIPAPGGFRF